jgi:hypothetical protein
MDGMDRADHQKDDMYPAGPVDVGRWHKSTLWQFACRACWLLTTDAFVICLVPPPHTRGVEAD